MWTLKYYLKDKEITETYLTKKDGVSLFFTYPVRDADGKVRKTKLLCWTTTPWALYANNAVLINEDADYLVIKYEHNYFYVSLASLKFLDSYLNLKNVKIVRFVVDKQREFYDAKAINVVSADELPIYGVSADYVRPDIGSGVVLAASRYSENDFNAVYNKVLDTDFLKNDLIYRGFHALKTWPDRRALKYMDKKVIEKLDENVIKYAPRRHLVPTDENGNAVFQVMCEINEENDANSEK